MPPSDFHLHLVSASSARLTAPLHLVCPCRRHLHLNATSFSLASRQERTWYGKEEGEEKRGKELQRPGGSSFDTVMMVQGSSQRGAAFVSLKNTKQVVVTTVELSRISTEMWSGTGTHSLGPSTAKMLRHPSWREMWWCVCNRKKKKKKRQ